MFFVFRNFLVIAKIFTPSFEDEITVEAIASSLIQLQKVFTNAS